MKKLSKKRIVHIASVVLLVGLCIWILWGNVALEINEYTIISAKIPEAFSGFRIAQISDLHNAEFGDDNSELIAMLAKSAPDVIVITGDLIDSNRTDINIAMTFAKQAVAIAPVYYVTGNHEAWISEYEELEKGLLENGVTILENQKAFVTGDGTSITLIGLSDPGFHWGDAESVSASALSELQDESEGYTILLAHRPELFETYVDAGIDLVFSGHAHGGQFRLPFIGGLVAPNQGFFPEYDAGLFFDGSTTMIVSRGLGNSIIPVRFNNRPEIVVVTLRNRN